MSTSTATPTAGSPAPAPPWPETLRQRLDQALARLYPKLVAWAEPRYRIGPSIFRLCFGVFALYQLLINYAQRSYLFGPTGVWPFAQFKDEIASVGSFSLYAWSDHQIWFELVYHGHAVVAALWLLGYRVRLLTPLFWVFHWSLHERFGMLWDGGDNMGYIVLIYLSFADVGHHFAPLGRERPVFDATRFRHVAAGLLHNVAIFACIIQISILYFNAGVAKLDGQYWQNGTALYYALRAGEYNVNPGLSQLVWDNPFFLALSTYGTLLFQLSFPFVILFGTRLFRVVIVMIAISFHLGILFAMGLTTFGLFMLAYEPLLLKDHEFLAIHRGMKLGGLPARTWAWVRARVRMQRPGSVPDEQPVAVVIGPGARNGDR